MRKCQYCPQEAIRYIYALGICPLDSSVQTCADHVEQGSKNVNVGHGVENVCLSRN